MAIVLNPAGIAYDHLNGTVNVPNAHALNNHFSLMGVSNAAAGTRDYWIQNMQALALALSRSNPINGAELRPDRARDLRPSGSDTGLCTDPIDRFEYEPGGCGTLGCTLPFGHLGPCTTVQPVTRPRPTYPA